MREGPFWDSSIPIYLAYRCLYGDLIGFYAKNYMGRDSGQIKLKSELRVWAFARRFFSWSSSSFEILLLYSSCLYVLSFLYSIVYSTTYTTIYSNPILSSPIKRKKCAKSLHTRFKSLLDLHSRLDSYTYCFLL